MMKLMMKHWKNYDFLPEEQINAAISKPPIIIPKNHIARKVFLMNNPELKNIDKDGFYMINNKPSLVIMTVSNPLFSNVAEDHDITTNDILYDAIVKFKNKNKK